MKTKLYAMGAILGGVLAADAAVISINITNGDAPRQILGTESTGLINTTGWNNISASTTNIDGTGVNLTLSGTVGTSNTLRDGSGDGTDGFLALYEAGLRDGSGGTTGDSTLSLSGLSGFMTANSATDYRIIAYYKSPLNLTSGDAFQIRVGATVNTGTFVTTNTPDNANMSVSDSFVQLGSAENNWMEFTGLTTDTAVVEVNRTSRDGLLTGIQIEAVPESSSAALLGLGGLALILRRRK